MSEHYKPRPTPNQRLHRERERRCWSQQELADKVGTTPLNVGRWERGATQPGPFFRQKLCEVFEMTPQQLGFLTESAETEAVVEASQSAIPASSPPTEVPALLWNVPYRRNMFFTGREDILSQLHATLISEQEPIALAQPQAISGLGGIGKTQTALEYAYRYRDSYTAVLWARADSHDLLISDFLTIASLLNLPEHNEQDQGKVVKAVIRWFDTHDRWLLILDNADHPDILDEFIPSAGKGHVLLTTRAQAFGTVAQRLELDQMELEEGTLFLLRRTKRIKGNAELESVSATVREQAQAIVEAVDGLPLALDQAGAYLEETGCSLVDYLKFYKTRRNRLLRTRGRDASGHPEPVAATWSLSFEKIERANPAAAELLRLCAFLHPDAIPKSMLVEGASELGPMLQALLEDELELNDAIGELRKYSLVKRDAEAKILNMHRLVQVVLKDAMDREAQKEWAERTVRMINRSFPDPNKIEMWPLCQQYLPHAQTCAALIAQLDIILPEATHLLNEVGKYLQQRAQYGEAEVLFKHALNLNEQIAGPEHPDVATSMNNLAMLYWYLGRYEQAELLCLRALEIREKIFGSANRDVALSFNDLAVIYDNQGKYAQAEHFYERGLAIWEQIPGPAHPDMMTNMSNLGLFYSQQGRYAQAEQLQQQVLALREQILGPGHPDVAFSLSHLGVLYYSQGKYSQAEAMWLRALTIREQVLGPEHPDVGSILHNLASLYRNQGKFTQSESFFQKALTIRERSLGLQHPDVAQTLNNLAGLYLLQGKYAQAEPIAERSVAIRELALGPEHSLLAISLINLGMICVAQEKYAQAESLYQRALAIREKSLTPNHPDIAGSLNELANLYIIQDKRDEAKVLFQRALSIREQSFGMEHPDLAKTLHDFAQLCCAEGEYEQAEQFFRRALAIREKVLGPEHPDVATTLENYAELLRQMERDTEAEVLEERAQAIRARRP